MKFVFVFIVVMLAVAQAKFLMSTYSLNDAAERNEIDSSVHALRKEKLFVPMKQNVQCNKSGCNALCQALGYSYGTCVSDTTCQCS